MASQCGRPNGWYELPHLRMSHRSLAPWTCWHVMLWRALHMHVQPQTKSAAGSGKAYPASAVQQRQHSLCQTCRRTSLSNFHYSTHSIHHVVILTISQASSAHRNGVVPRCAASCARRPAVRWCPQLKPVTPDANCLSAGYDASQPRLRAEMPTSRWTSRMCHQRPSPTSLRPR